MFARFSDVNCTILNMDDVTGCRIEDIHENVYPYRILLYLNSEYENPMVLEYTNGSENQQLEDFEWVSEYLLNEN